MAQTFQSLKFNNPTTKKKKKSRKERKKEVLEAIVSGKVDNQRYWDNLKLKDKIKATLSGKGKWSVDAQGNPTWDIFDSAAKMQLAKITDKEKAKDQRKKDRVNRQQQAKDFRLRQESLKLMGGGGWMDYSSLSDFERDKVNLVLSDEFNGKIEGNTITIGDEVYNIEGVSLVDENRKQKVDILKPTIYPDPYASGITPAYVKDEKGGTIKMPDRYDVLLTRQDGSGVVANKLELPLSEEFEGEPTYGDEEFGTMLPEVTPTAFEDMEQAAEVKEEILSSLDKTRSKRIQDILIDKGFIGESEIVLDTEYGKQPGIPTGTEKGIDPETGEEVSKLAVRTEPTKQYDIRPTEKVEDAPVSILYKNDKATPLAIDLITGDAGEKNVKDIFQEIYGDYGVDVEEGGKVGDELVLKIGGKELEVNLDGGVKEAEETAKKIHDFIKENSEKSTFESFNKPTLANIRELQERGKVIGRQLVEAQNKENELKYKASLELIKIIEAIITDPINSVSNMLEFFENNSQLLESTQLLLDDAEEIAQKIQIKKAYLNDLVKVQQELTAGLLNAYEQGIDPYTGKPAGKGNIAGFIGNTATKTAVESIAGLEISLLRLLSLFGPAWTDEGSKAVEDTMRNIRGNAEALSKELATDTEEEYVRRLVEDNIFAGVLEQVTRMGAQFIGSGFNPFLMFLAMTGEMTYQNEEIIGANENIPTPIRGATVFATGLIGGLLERAGFERMLPRSTTKRAIPWILSKIKNRKAGFPKTPQELSKAIGVQIEKLAHIVQRGGEVAFIETVTELSQEVVNKGAVEILTAVYEEEGDLPLFREDFRLFNNPNLLAQIKQVIKISAATGGLMGNISAVVDLNRENKLRKINAKEFNRLMTFIQDPAAVEAYQMQLVKDLIDGKPLAEVQSKLQSLKEIQDLINQIPTNLDEDTKQKIFLNLKKIKALEAYISKYNGTLVKAEKQQIEDLKKQNEELAANPDNRIFGEGLTLEQRQEIEEEQAKKDAIAKEKKEGKAVDTYIKKVNEQAKELEKAPILTIETTQKEGEKGFERLQEKVKKEYGEAAANEMDPKNPAMFIQSPTGEFDSFIVINKPVLFRQPGSALDIVAHDVGHKLFEKALLVNPKLASELKNNLREHLIKKGDNDLVEKLDQREQQYRDEFPDESEAYYNEEWIMNFIQLDAIPDASFWQKLLKLFNDLMKVFGTTEDGKPILNAKDGESIYKFLQGIKEFGLDLEVDVAETETTTEPKKETTTTKASLPIKGDNQIDMSRVIPRDSEGNYTMTQDEWITSPEFKALTDAFYDERFDPLINKYLEPGDNIYGQPRKKIMKEVAEEVALDLYRFDPKQAGIGSDLGKFITQRIRDFRVGDVTNRYKDKGLKTESLDVSKTSTEPGSKPIDPATQDLDPLELLQKKEAEEKAKKEAEEKLKVQQREIIPGLDQKIEEELDKTNYSKMAEVTEGFETERKTTPFIQDLKNKFSQDLFKVVVKGIGSKKSSPTITEFLMEKGEDGKTNLEMILLRMPESYLDNRMFYKYGLVQKSVGGKYKKKDGQFVKDSNGRKIFEPNWTTDHKGKKIDREQTAAGAQRIRINPAIESIISKNLPEILKLFVKEDGSPNQMRIEGLAKQYVAKRAIEMLNEKLSDPKFRERFKEIKELSGESLSTDFAQKIDASIERGLTSKMSLPLRRFQQNNPEGWLMTRLFALPKIAERISIEGFDEDTIRKVVRQILNEENDSWIKQEGGKYLSKKEINTIIDEIQKLRNKFKDLEGRYKKIKIKPPNIFEFITERMSPEEVAKGTKTLELLGIKDVKKQSDLFADKTQVENARDIAIDLALKSIERKQAAGLTRAEATLEVIEEQLKYFMPQYSGASKIGMDDFVVPIDVNNLTGPRNGVGSVLEKGPGNSASGTPTQVFMNNADYIENFLNRLDPNVQIRWSWNNTDPNFKGTRKAKIKDIVVKDSDGKIIETKKPDRTTPSQSSKGAQSSIKKKIKSGMSKVEARKAVYEEYKKHSDKCRELLKEFMEDLVKINNGKNKYDLKTVFMAIKGLQSNMSTILRGAAEFKYIYEGNDVTPEFENIDNPNKTCEWEHNPPAEVMVNLLTNYYFNDNKEVDISKVFEEYTIAVIPKSMNDALNSLGLRNTMQVGFGPDSESIGRYFNSDTMGKDMFALTDLSNGKVRGKNWRDASDIVNNKKVVTRNANLIKSSGVTVKPALPISNQELIRQAEVLDKAMSIARDPNAPVKKIRVFDFDDTLARTNSNVLYTMPDGTTGKLTAEEFAKKGDELLSKGAEFDFSEFNKVVDGKPGPLLDIAKKIQKARGTEDVFILTARAPEAATAIKEFLDGLGLKIPLKNITGLGDSSPLAKSNWIVDKAAEGYNDFYFADDHIGNVDAVKKVLDIIDVKSKVQQAKVKFSLNAEKTMNNIIAKKFGIEQYKEYSPARAALLGSEKDRLKIYPASMYDMEAFIRELLTTGKEGDEQMAWFQEHLFEPYNRGMLDLARDRNQLNKDFAALKKYLVDSGKIPKNLRKQALKGFTYEDVVRIYTWDQQGIEIEGLSKTDLEKIRNFVSKDEELQLFSAELLNINKGSGYAYPGAGWIAGNIGLDLQDGLNKIKRAKYLKQWKENVDLMFSNKILNKIEVAKGTKYREALENILKRMETGVNRSQSMGKLETKLSNLINNSTGTVMLLNTRSALLQLLSWTNFIDFVGDNNLVAAAGAFANIPQYSKDFMTILKSDYLVDRRSGLKINVTESEIADAVRSKNPYQAIVSTILNKGYAFTKVGDSIAIALGGATFYRNTIKGLMKRNPEMSIKEAESKAMEMFRERSEKSQQSGDPSKISAQQASAAGRFILAFANTPIQYNRIIFGALKDLKEGRGNWKQNVSKIVYYSTIQNAIFTGLQQALFVLMGDDEGDEEEKKRYIRVANGMVDNILRGGGVGGQAIATMKNLVMDLYMKYEKSIDPNATWYEKKPDYEDSLWKVLEFSPPLSIKLRKIRSAIKNWEMNKYKHESQPWSWDDPAYLSGAQVVSGAFDIPLDRLYYKIENIRAAFADEMEVWQRLARLAGYKEWEIETKEQKEKRKAEDKKERAEVKKQQTGPKFKSTKFKKAKFKTP